MLHTIRDLGDLVVRLEESMEGLGEIGAQASDGGVDGVGEFVFAALVDGAPNLLAGGEIGWEAIKPFVEAGEPCEHDVETAGSGNCVAEVAGACVGV